MILFRCYLAKQGTLQYKFWRQFCRVSATVVIKEINIKWKERRQKIMMIKVVATDTTYDQIDSTTSKMPSSTNGENLVRIFNQTVFEQNIDVFFFVTCIATGESELKLEKSWKKKKKNVGSFFLRYYCHYRKLKLVKFFLFSLLAGFCVGLFGFVLPSAKYDSVVGDFHHISWACYSAYIIRISDIE